MRYRNRTLAEQCIVPPQLEVQPDSPGAGARPIVSADLQTMLVRALARELARAFEEDDAVAFDGALYAMTQAALSSSRWRSRS